MNHQDNINSQLLQANGILRDMKDQLTRADRKAAIMDGYSKSTLVQYLKGEGKALDTALDLIEYFKKRISQRKRTLAAELK